jgi:hypothetical protein
LIDDAMRRVPGVWIKSLVKPYGERGIKFWVSARGDDRAKLEARVEEAIRILIELTGSAYHRAKASNQTYRAAA